MKKANLLRISLPLTCILTCALGVKSGAQPSHPFLSITSHVEGQLVGSPSITLAGTASDLGRGGQGITKVTVNGLRATGDTAVGDGTANWSRALTLLQGKNTLKVVATDGGRNSTTNVLHISLDSVKPVNAIIYPAVGQRVTNANIVARGKVSDKNPAVVWVQLNNGPWLQPIGITNWSLPLTLVPGTNYLQAFAEDALGRRSTTNRVRFTYVVYAPIQVQATKGGTVTPNYNGKYLEVGKSYSMIATQAAGFSFVGWTDGNGNAITNSKTLRFVMTSNLVFRANFADSQRPAIMISSPAAGAKLTSGTLTAAGSAKDNAGVQAVYCQLNMATWQQSSGTTQWTFSGQLDAGPNTLSVYAVDLNGNYSTTNRLSVIYLKDVLKTYWPMHDGDNKTYSGAIGDATVQFWGSDWLGYTMNLTTPQDDVTASYNYSGDGKQLLLTGGEYGWTHYRFVPSIVELTESQLLNGGSRSVNSSVSVSGQKIPVKAIIKVTAAGTITVPAGTFRDCKRIDVDVTANVNGQEVKASVEAYVLAPKVGMIKVAVYKAASSESFTFVGWESLTGGTVGGVDVKTLASQ